MLPRNSPRSYTTRSPRYPVATSVHCRFQAPPWRQRREGSSGQMTTNLLTGGMITLFPS
jgi:hypothetical protein